MILSTPPVPAPAGLSRVLSPFLPPLGAACPVAVACHRSGCMASTPTTVGKLLKSRGRLGFAAEPPGMGLSGFYPSIGNKIDMVRRSHIFLRVNFVPFVH